eukprot:TRINITY_DN4668_c0_g1_i3.p2 TRINITY_DN4668_c0_g1~~TRINITY_DN4668_c0_g1_i3.p2  ORF type:complete len:219 (-),score=50.15 TRINITY_DN4668_c0_g1_i3:23-679(-)
MRSRVKHRSATGLMGEHLTKFLTVDKVSDNDSGCLEGQDILAALAKEVGSTASWAWHPEGYYDDCRDDVGPPWATYRQAEDITFDELRKRVTKAAAENSTMSKFHDMGTGKLAPRRDKEYGFRFVEFRIRKGEPVTILAKPVATVVDGVTTIVLAPPDEEVEGHMFRFRILQGHSIRDAIHQRKLSEMQWSALGVGGALLTAWGLLGFTSFLAPAATL